jgi:hypothetical protein
MNHIRTCSRRRSLIIRDLTPNAPYGGIFMRLKSFFMASIKPFLIFVVTAVLLFVDDVVYAEPSPLINKLMNTPTSLFHYGINQVQERAYKFLESENMSDSTIVGVKYDWDKNVILIEFTIINSKCATRTACINEGKNVINKYVERNCVTQTNSVNQCDFFDFLSTRFSPNGFDIPKFHDGKPASEAISQLKHIFEIRSSANFFPKSNDLAFRCVRKYAEKDVFCTDSK